MSRGRYVVVQRTGFMPYFLCTWQPNEQSDNDGWNCLRDRALVFDGPTARQIVNALNAKRPAAPVRVIVEALP